MSPLITGSPQPTGLHGVDVSHANGIVDFTGQDFVWVKATQGTTYADAYHDTNVLAALGSGAVTGSYHFLEDGNGAQQADWYAAHVKGVPDTHLFAVDVEIIDSTTGSHPRPADLQAFAARFAELFPGRPLIVYTYQSFWEQVFGNPVASPDWLLWDSWIHPEPRALYGGFTRRPFHQYDTTSLDKDVFYGTKADLLALAEAAVPDTPAQPTEEPMLIIRAKDRPAALVTPAPTGPLARYLSSAEWQALYRLSVVNPAAVQIEVRPTPEHDALTGGPSK